MYKIRYVFLVTLLTSSAFSAPPEGREVKDTVDRVESTIPSINGTLSTKQTLDDIYNNHTPVQLYRVVLRTALEAALGYDLDKLEQKYSPPKYLNPELECVFSHTLPFKKGSQLITKRLKYFRKIAESYGIKVTSSLNLLDQWRDLHEIIALQNAIYPLDRTSSRKDIKKETKQRIAIECLLHINPEFLKQDNIQIAFETNAFELAKKVQEENNARLAHPVAVILAPSIAQEDSDVKEKSVNQVMEVLATEKKVEEQKYIHRIEIVAHSESDASNSEDVAEGARPLIEHASQEAEPVSSIEDSSSVEHVSSVEDASQEVGHSSSASYSSLVEDSSSVEDASQELAHSSSEYPSSEYPSSEYPSSRSKQQGDHL